MADSRAVGGVGTFVGGEGGGGARAMMGGSLPPRKRLLAGLKQNGLLLAASSQALRTTPASVHGLEGGGAVEGGVVLEGSSSAQEEPKGNCMSCGAPESTAWRRVKRNGAVQRVCNSCTLLSNKNMRCLHCQVSCPDVTEPSVWLQCDRCQRVVHVECEKKSSLSTRLDIGCYACPECLEVKMHNDLASGLLRIGAHGCGGRVGMNCSLESGNCASSAATEFSSPCSKKPRVLKDPRSQSDETVAQDAGEADGIGNAKAMFERKGVASQGAIVAAAEAAAALAGRAAKAAKATAAAKAVTAVKAAAAAKAALDAAALAARAEAQARAQLRRSSFFSEHSTVEGVSKYEGVHGETKKETAAKIAVKIEGEEIPSATPSSIDDEELARQLHRVINSSPRISRGLTPLRRKPAGQPGTVSNCSDSVRVWPRSGLSTATEPRPQLKQQQTRPRSMPQKDVKRLDSRVVKHESRTADSDSFQNSLQHLACTTVSDDGGQVVALRSDPADSRTVTLGRQDSEVSQRQASRGALSEVLVKTEIDRLNGVTLQVLDGIDGNQHELLSVAVVSKAAAMFDDVLVSETNATKEGYLPRLRIGMSPHLKGEVGPPTSLIAVSSAGVRELEGQEEREIAERGGMMDMGSGVATLAEVASSAMEVLDFPEVSPSRILVEGQWALHGDGDDLEVDHDQDSLSQLIAKGPRSLSEEFTFRNGKGASEFDGSSSDGLSQLAVNGKPWQRGILQGIPGGGKGFASGVHLSPFSSAPPIPIRTPALAGRSTTRDS